MIVYRQESYDIIGAAFDVYNKLGHGFLEADQRMREKAAPKDFEFSNS